MISDSLRWTSLFVFSKLTMMDVVVVVVVVLEVSMLLLMTRTAGNETLKEMRITESHLLLSSSSLSYSETMREECYLLF